MHVGNLLHPTFEMHTQTPHHPFLFLESVLKVHHYTGDNKHGKVDLANSRLVNLWGVLLPPFV